MISNMEFSVIVPVLNEEKRISKCLNSMKNLDYPKDKYEVIVVDNGSTDKSVGIAKSFGYKVVKESKKGITFARQKGLEEAKGKYYITTDADARVPKDWLKNAKKSFEEDKNVVGVTGPVYAYDTSRLYNKLIVYPLSQVMPRLIKHLNGCNMAVKTETAKKAGGFTLRDYKFFEDSIITLRLKKKGKIKFNKQFINHISLRRYQGLSGIKASLRNLINYFGLKYKNKIFFDVLPSKE